MTATQDTAPAHRASPPGLPQDGPPMDDADMGPRQLAYFRQKLLDWRETLLVETQEALAQTAMRAAAAAP